MNEAEILKKLAGVGALIQNSHLVYTSGRHGSAYVNKDAIYPHTRLTSELCRELAGRFKDAGIEVCLAPAIGGVILSQWTAYHLTELTGREVLGVYAEKSPDGEGFILKRGYDKLTRGKKVLVLEDVLTTGISVKRTVETVRAIGGNVAGVAALCNRGGVGTSELGDVPMLEALVKVQLESWEKEACPLCRTGVPVNTELGKGKTL